MQEEVENRTVNLAISTTKLTFRTIVNGYNAVSYTHLSLRRSETPLQRPPNETRGGRSEGESVWGCWRRSEEHTSELQSHKATLLLPDQDVLNALYRCV